MTAELFRIDALSTFVAIFIGLFSLITIIYSTVYMKGRSGLTRYYSYVVLTFAASMVAVFADNFLLFLLMWGVLGLLLFLLIAMGRREGASLSAKKAFVVVGGTDALMLMGFGILWQHSSFDLTTLPMSSVSLEINDSAALVAFLCLASAALAKAGAMPFHSWVPDAAENAPLPATAFLLASLDKLLGIYLLARLILEMFILTPAVYEFLMLIGAITIIAAVMMAMIQHDLRRLLGYCTVSQVGYMVLGLGTGTMIGAAGGLFHMVNHAIYECGLFLAGGNVEHRLGTSELEKMGGLASRMPWTFAAFVTGVLAISGIPPLNGFASKWLVYQGVIEAGARGDSIWLLCLGAALFGTALTLAIFMKVLHAVFLGQSGLPAPILEKVREVSWPMWLPPIVLALLCVVFGVFAFQIPLALFVLPSLPGEVAVIGLWEAGTATLMILGALVLGLLLYWATSYGKVRETESFVGGEILDQQEDMRISGVQFYRTIRELPLLKGIYNAAEVRWFDPYEVSKRLVLGASRILGLLHNGLLPRYVSWCLFGIVLIVYFLAG
jgi:NADH:ubiquinone oxidoreductase subunit 5 (subunit L)/multisubunit Na+/H+ antiporter MnhA subunit